MKFLYFSFTLVITALLLHSCAKPKISNLQRGTYNYKTTAADILDVSVNMLPIPKNPETKELPKTFFDLRDSLPHVFLKIMSEKTKTSKELIEVLKEPLSKEAAPVNAERVTDYTLYKVRFAFSNLKKYYNDALFMHPNTRLEFLTTSLTIPTGTNVTFYNIDRLENEFEDIDLGTLSRDHAVTFNAKLTAEGALGTSYSKSGQTKNEGGSSRKSGNSQSVYDAQGNVIGTVNNSGDFSTNRLDSGSTSSSTAANLKANAEVGYLNSETIKEAVAVKLRRLRTGFNFSEDKLIVAQRGRPLGDISDNIYITATLKVANAQTVSNFEVSTFDKLYDSNNEPNAAKKIEYLLRLVSLISCDKSSDVQLNSSYEGAVRVVANKYTKNGSNALEYDDKVSFYKINGAAKKSISIDKNLYCKDVYKIICTDLKGGKYTLKVATKKADEVLILKEEFPGLLLQWILDMKDTPSIEKLSSSNLKLYFENDINHDRIYIVKAKMEAADIKLLKNLNEITAVKRG